MRIPDWCFRLAYRLAYPVVDRWWRLRGQHHGATVALWLGERVLAVRHSYKPGFRLPGGGVAPAEDHRSTAVRELAEEVGVTIDPDKLRYIMTVSCRHGMVHVYEALLTAAPTLKIDNREIIEAAFVSPNALIEPNGTIAAYLVSLH